MATTETRNVFSKDKVTKEEVEAEAADRRNDPGVVEVRVEEEGNSWVLVTVRTVIG